MSRSGSFPQIVQCSFKNHTYLSSVKLLGFFRGRFWTANAILTGVLEL